MSSEEAFYGLRKNGKAHGDVFTHPDVVEYMLDLSDYRAERNLSAVTVMEPSCGDGAFLIAITHRLKESALLYGFDLDQAYHKNIIAMDIDPVKIIRCVDRMKQLFPEINNPEDKIIEGDYLLTSLPPVDIVIGNPPYIRYENIPDTKIEEYKQRFSTFFYRADIYVLFYEHSLKQLKSNGKHCFICSNRWIKGYYGKKIRRLIAQNYHINYLIDMERADAFTESVHAYPSITLITNETLSGNLLYGQTSSVEQLPNICFKPLVHPVDENWNTMFPTINDVQPLPTIEEQGFRIGIGVATGADRVFISKCLKGLIEDELLIPAINAHDLKNNTLQWDERYLLNPYTASGSLINLSRYPKCQNYLEANRAKLSSRHISKNNPNKWYATIDRIKPELQHTPKILLPDMTSNEFIFVDEGKYYPLHNIYYIVGRSVKELKVLSSILMSDHVRSQLDCVTNHMNGGYARWQSQHLKKLRLPDINLITEDEMSLIIQCYDRHDIASINSIVDHIVNKQINHKEQNVHKRHIPVQQTIAFNFA